VNITLYSDVIPHRLVESYQRSLIFSIFRVKE